MGKKTFPDAGRFVKRIAKEPKFRGAALVPQMPDKRKKRRPPPFLRQGKRKTAATQAGLVGAFSSSSSLSELATCLVSCAR